MSEMNGNARGRQQEKVRVAIIGVGNCSNSFMQGLTYYHEAKRDEFVPGLMHVDLGGYHISDIEVVAAFDVVKGKVGVDLADAIWAHPNDTIKFADVPKTGVTVSRGMTLDGIGKYLSQVVEKDEGPTDDIVGILKDRQVDVVVNYLPVGSEDATKWYAEQIMAAGCAMVNCMPVFIAREDYWNKRFQEAGVPIIGDDIKSQVGATITHRVLTSLFRERGVHLDKTMQLNVGGNSDFLNMLERERLESKKISKTNAVTSMLDYDLGAGNVHVGPSDYVPWLTDRKWAYIRLEGSSFGDVPLNVEMKLEVWDSPNSAGIVIDAVRLAKLALEQRHRRVARRPELLPDEVAAGADRGRRRIRARRRVHRAQPPRDLPPGPGAGLDGSRAALRGGPYPSSDVWMRICLVTPFAWSQPHDVNDHVAGVARGLRAPRARGDGAGAVDPGGRPAGRTASADTRRASRRDRTRRGRADLPALAARCARGRPGEPRARTRAGAVRRRPRLRAGPALAVVPRVA